MKVIEKIEGEWWKNKMKNKKKRRNIKDKNYWRKATVKPKTKMVK